MKNLYLYLKLICLDLKKIIITAFVSLLIMAVFISAFAYFEKRQSLIENFSLGIVVEDENKYLDLLLTTLFSRKDLENVIEFELMSREDADRLIKNNQIPCYIVIEKGFINSVITGENKNIVFVGNKDYPIKYNISEALVKAGTAFLSSSQSGIYSVIDYSYKYNISDYDKDKIIKDINIAFAKTLLNYKDYFDSNIIYPTGTLPLRVHYLHSFIIFFLIVNMISLLDSVKRLLNRGVIDRVVISGTSYFKYFFQIFSSIFIFISLITIPVSYFFGIKIIFLSIILTGLIIVTVLLFKDSVSGGLFIFSLAVIMLFISGGVIPKGLLPDSINKLSFLTINNYFISDNMPKFLIYTFVVLLFTSFVFRRKEGIR